MTSKPSSDMKACFRFSLSSSLRAFIPFEAISSWLRRRERANFGFCLLNQPVELTKFVCELRIPDVGTSSLGTPSKDVFSVVGSPTKEEKLVLAHDGSPKFFVLTEIRPCIQPNSCSPLCFIGCRHSNSIHGEAVTTRGQSINC